MSAREITFDEARDIHSKVYPLPFDPSTEYVTLAIAAAFEGMHHWESDQRRKGDALDHAAAESSLSDVVRTEAERLVDTSQLAKYFDLDARGAFSSIATHQALYFYDKQYWSKADMYDPRQMSAHETMAGEWVGEGGGEDEGGEE